MKRYLNVTGDRAKPHSNHVRDGTVLEADGDRLVYHTAWETLSSEVRLDVHFAAVGGTGGIADICQLYRTLHIPVAVIADLDLVADTDKLQRILQALASDVEAAPIIEEAEAIAEAIRKCPPTIDATDFKARIDEVRGMGTDWEHGDDIEIRKRLRSIAQDLDRMRRLKTGAIYQESGDISKRLEKLVGSLRDVGIFLVPVGELEGWLKSYDVNESKSNKAAWANATALKIPALCIKCTKADSSNGAVQCFLWMPCVS